MLTSEWSNRQVNLWKVELISFLLVSGTAAYTLPGRVAMVLDAYFSTNQGLVTQTDLFMDPLSRDEYSSYPMKQTPGQPSSYWFNRQITPIMNTYPVYNSTTTTAYVNYYACVQVQDAGIQSGETPDVPVRWYDALVAGLAHRLARSYAKDQVAERKTDYDEAWAVAAGADTENVNVTLSPDFGGYYR